MTVPDTTSVRQSAEPDYTPTDPCPVCDHDGGWCTWYTRPGEPRPYAVACMRLDTWGDRRPDREGADGRHVYRLTGDDPRPTISAEQRSRTAPAVDWAAFTARAVKALTDCTAPVPPDVLLARSLRLPDDAYRALLDLGDWADRSGPAVCWPEVLGGAVVGAMRRTVERVPGRPSKQALPGAQRGLTLTSPPPGWRAGGPILVVEGESDVVACHAAGLHAIGRPGANSSPEVVAALADVLRTYPGSPVVVVGENDNGVGVTDPYVLADQLRAKIANTVMVAMTPDLPAEAVTFEAHVKDTCAYLTADGWGDVTWPERGDRLLAGLLAGTDKPAPKGPQDGQTGAPVLRTTCAADVRVKAQRWLIKGRIPRGCGGSLYGPPGEGKSTLMGEIVAAVTTGRCAFGESYRDPAHGHVLWISAEESSAGRVVPRLMAAGADITKVHVDACLPTTVNAKTGTREITLSEADIDAIRRRVLSDRANGIDVVLIVLDPITSFVGRTKVDGKTLDDHKATELRLALDPLGRMADELAITVLAIAHTNKNTKAGVLDRMAGSSAYVSAMRFACAVSRDPTDEDARLMVTVKTDTKVKDTAVVFRERALTDAEAGAIKAAPQFADLEPADRDDTVEDLRRLEFDEPRHVNHGDLFGAPKVSETVGRAVDAARGHLSAHSDVMASTELDRLMAADGYSDSVVGRAKTALRRGGVTTWKVGFGSDAKTMIGVRPPRYPVAAASAPANPLDGLE